MAEKSNIVLVFSLSLLFLVCGSAFAQIQGPASSLLDNLRNIGAIQNPANPCLGITCGTGQYCAVVNMGSSSIRTYQCRAIAIPPTVLPTVPQCYDKVEIRVPATATNSLSRASFGMTAQRPCLNQCVSDWSCGGPNSGRICCMQGCDRICYSPKTTVVDYTVTTPYPFGTVLG